MHVLISNSNYKCIVAACHMGVAKLLLKLSEYKLVDKHVTLNHSVLF